MMNKFFSLFLVDKPYNRQDHLRIPLPAEYVSSLFKEFLPQVTNGAKMEGAIHIPHVIVHIHNIIE
ncbi:hypothetical protein HN51_057330 [Arachis hypogaea]